MAQSIGNDIPLTVVRPYQKLIFRVMCRKPDGGLFTMIDCYETEDRAKACKTRNDIAFIYSEEITVWE